MNNKKKIVKIFFYDKILFFLLISLSIIGIIIVSSASISFGIRLHNDYFYFAKRNLLYFFLSFFLFFQIIRIPINQLEKYNKIALLINLFLLIIVFIIGNSINGAIRWIKIGFFSIQPSECSKLILFFYISDYIVKKNKELKNKLWGFLKPIIIMLIFVILLLMQPDLGNSLILFLTTLLLFFLAGINLWKCCFMFLFGLLTIFILIIFKPYRIRRILSFLDPWEDPFNSGYQLTQSLMALGRGKIIGTGLGNSIQKLEYLPEAYTDFIFSILGEELGYIGSIIILIMLFFVIFRIFLIGKNSFIQKKFFSGYFSFSVGIWISLQTIMNVGGVIGILPIKGLTLPFISYGGSSLITIFSAIAIVIRSDFELRINKYQAYLKQ
ncbi:ftsW [Wigglesworthia glossinidia endosymbiont of Glossina brevipalpis]|uniref:Probable peptidoglycan glycosyltransferase FtsW n=1 Tax=Wigglesworthia glossinidia brevipalpis TaxID=36870 RepID=FTSW_WIGBR|nr:RecName: Full=Probable peptidoglycan glycosyltransferase FtsW; Short=PGT; AltName: Full=Cell division protein FtsW; AltName: Full=Cell wall polymerase; AltName: Full=Peptidoglycan polymerase; Short=PG polymerase [Wigglesworthia glossinidia endosymbiont of Glossina brevipalpis]BAC24353.1 ftsW [Wigglesworthia glossinidia endosymbiont of Glossina brevipalpis]